VTGVVIPLRLNPVPVAATWEIVTLAPPVFVTVSDSDWLLPTVTLPKFRLVGLDPAVPTATPVPASGTESVEFEPVEVTVTVPLALPEAAGTNLTVKVVLCPEVSVTGVVIPVELNPVPLVAT